MTLPTVGNAAKSAASARFAKWENVKRAPEERIAMGSGFIQMILQTAGNAVISAVQAYIVDGASA